VVDFAFFALENPRHPRNPGLLLPPSFIRALSVFSVPSHKDFLLGSQRAAHCLHAQWAAKQVSIS